MDDPRLRSDLEHEYRALVADLRRAFRGWGAAPGPEETGWSQERFREFALRAFRVQYAGNAPYRRYCDRRGASPDRVGEWRAVPPVPTAGFREVRLVVGGPSRAKLDFRTSGTTRGEAARGRHLVRDPELYRASVEPPFGRHVLGVSPPGGETTGARSERAWRFCSLIPPFSSAPDSSLAWMADAVMERFGAEEPVRAATGDGMDWDAARRFAEETAAGEEPACVLATTMAAAAWVERLAAAGDRVELPPGSRVMDTGGTKGRPGLERADVLRGLQERLGVPPGRVVNEFGMTELLSQRYGAGPEASSGAEASAGAGPGDVSEECAGPWLEGPPWLRTRALDPVTLEELPPGKPGVLCHFDLANAGSVCAVLTEDMGRVREGRVRHLGRAEGSPPRGCSLATAELLRAQEPGS